MPSCFQLTRKGDTKPSVLQYIDRCICQNCDIPYSTNEWAGNWYNIIGLGLACGHSFDKLIDIYTSTGSWELVRIAAYLNENYTSNAWHER